MENNAGGIHSFPRGRQVLEIACGNGHFLCELAQARPDDTFTGIDIQQERVDRCLKKVGRLGLEERVMFIRGDARRYLREKTAGFDEIFVTFPDPWPKFRHRKHRLNEPAFFADILNALKPGGVFYWICDYYPQIIDIIAMGRRHRDIVVNLHEPAGYTEAVDTLPRTLYEEKWRSLDRKIFYVVFEKKSLV